MRITAIYGFVSPSLHFQSKTIRNSYETFTKDTVIIFEPYKSHKNSPRMALKCSRIHDEGVPKPALELLVPLLAKPVPNPVLEDGDLPAEEVDGVEVSEIEAHVRLLEAVEEEVLRERVLLANGVPGFDLHEPVQQPGEVEHELLQLPPQQH